ncbi:uncharacterized protein LOC126151204 [Schistocerca cancellata]|uniref:uncharacterized protein LOC126151204 n=1 Tax=Schistocerca cancellata TaxID=274614 RepID=UPI002118CAD3|nr:uncharacterized protein LOC126151204 [Schistocerca cancellata]
MVLKKHVPSFVTIGGHRGVVQYNGQPQTCSICSSTEHMRATCPRSRRPAQLPRTEAAEAPQEIATASYAGAVTREAPRVHETAPAEAAAPTAAATESPAATPPPAPVPAPAPAVAGSAGEKRQLSSDSEGESTVETDAALAPTPSPAARWPRIAEVSAPAQPTAAPPDSPAAQAGPSADAATPYSEMRELAIKMQVTKLARTEGIRRRAQRKQRGRPGRGQIQKAPEQAAKSQP